MIATSERGEVGQFVSPDLNNENNRCCLQGGRPYQL